MFAKIGGTLYWVCSKLTINNSEIRQEIRYQLNSAQPIHYTKNEVFHEGDQTLSFRQIWSQLVKKSLLKKFIFCGVIRKINQVF